MKFIVLIGTSRKEWDARQNTYPRKTTPHFSSAPTGRFPFLKK